MTSDTRQRSRRQDFTDIAEIAEVAEIADVAELADIAEISGEQLALANAAASAKVEKAAHARAVKKAKLLHKAYAALEKYNDKEDSLNQCDWLDLMRWVLTAAGKKCRVMDFTTKDLIIAKFATLDRAWTSYIPPHGATSNVAV
jgi:hypothetical protein